MKPGVVVREKRLIPVTTKPKNSKLEKLLGGIERSTLRDETLVCAMVSPDGNTGVFLDDTGREYLIKEKELGEKLTYITANYVKKQVDRYSKARRNVSSYQDLVKEFIERSDTPKRYKDWKGPEGLSTDDAEVEVQPEVNEEEELNEEGRILDDTSGIKDCDYVVWFYYFKKGNWQYTYTKVSHSGHGQTFKKADERAKKSVAQLIDNGICKRAHIRYIVGDLKVVDSYIKNLNRKDLNEEEVVNEESILKKGMRYIKESPNGKDCVYEITSNPKTVRGEKCVSVLDTSTRKVSLVKVSWIESSHSKGLIEFEDYKTMSEESLDEEQKYQKGKIYVSDDGEWKFKVISVSGGKVKIHDLTDNKKYNVELSDLELMNPELDEGATTTASIPARVDRNMGKKVNEKLNESSDKNEKLLDELDHKMVGERLRNGISDSESQRMYESISKKTGYSPEEVLELEDSEFEKALKKLGY